MSRLQIEKSHIKFADLGQRRRVEIYKSGEDEYTIQVNDTRKNTRKHMIMSESEFKGVVAAMIKMVEGK